MFESWLNEASNAKFDVNKPSAFPMLKVTQGDLYGGNEQNFKKPIIHIVGFFFYINTFSS
jgi:hypothetical protein